MIRVFLDANVYFAGFFSKTGASSLILQLAQRGKLQVVASHLVLREADRNLRKKAGRETVTAFHCFLKKTKVQVITSPSERTLRQYEASIHPKDVPVLTATLEAKVDFLITLDRRHFFTPSVMAVSGKLKILTPGDFLHQQIYQ